MNKVRFFISVLFLPAVIVLVYDFCKLFFSFAGETDINIVPFWLGIIVYILFQIIFFKPMETYVFGHEFTHAIVGIISGAKIKKFKVSRNGGSVSLTKDNVFITLSPYFVPLYTLAIIIIYYCLLGWFFDISKLRSYFLFFSGISLAFHYALTFYALRIGQEDMRVYGKFFSFFFVSFVNIVVLILVLTLIFPEVIDIRNFFSSVSADIMYIYKYIFTGVYKCLVFLKTK